MGKLIDIGHASADGYERGFVVAGVIALVTGLIGILIINPEKAARQLRGAGDQKSEFGRPIARAAADGRNA
jgi:hypothetical protein